MKPQIDLTLATPCPNSDRASLHPLLTLVILLTFAITASADAPPTAMTIQSTGVDTEGLRTFRLGWTALSNATYRVQSASSLAAGTVWQTLDTVKPTNTVGSYPLQVAATDSTGQPVRTKYFRLVLPQPGIFSVEPAILARRACR